MEANETSGKKKRAKRKTRNKDVEIDLEKEPSPEKQTPKKRKEIPMNKDGEIDWKRVTMGQLIYDIPGFGKPSKSSTEKDDEVVQQEPIEEEKEKEQEQSEEPEEEESEKTRNPTWFGARMKSLSEIDKSSLVVHQDDEKEEESYNVIKEKNAYITSASFSKRGRTEKWSEEETERFYKVLQQFGTDFTMMSYLFPNRDRRQIRNKFKREEKSNPDRINEALHHRQPIDNESCQEIIRRKTEIDEKNKKDEEEEEERRKKQIEEEEAREAAEEEENNKRKQKDDKEKQVGEDERVVEEEEEEEVVIAERRVEYDDEDEEDDDETSRYNRMKSRLYDEYEEDP